MPMSLALGSPAARTRPNVPFALGSLSGSVRSGTNALPSSRQAAPPAESSGSLSDEDLLARYRDLRRPEDFTEIFRRYSLELCRYLTRYLGNAALAEDVLQDTFLQVHAKCGLYRDGWPVKSWLYAVAIHRAVDAGRRARRLPAIRLDRTSSEDREVETGTLLELLASPEPGPLETLRTRERQQWVRESVAQLPEPQRQALVLAYYQGMPYSEIACLLNVPLGTVKSRLHGALARLREKAERHDWAGSRSGHGPRRLAGICLGPS